MFKIALCDNDKKYMNYIEELLKSRDFNENLFIEKFILPELILSNMKSNITYDIIIMETHFNSIDGITVADKIRKLDNDVKLIYVSSNNRYCVESYMVGTFCFFLKPLKEEYFIDTMKKCIASLRENKKTNVCLPIKNGFIRTNYTKIEYIDVYNKNIEYHFSDGNVMSYMGYIKEIEQKLSDFPCFYKINRSMIINIDYVVKVEHYEITLESGLHIIIGKNKFKAVKDAISKQFE